MRILMTTFFVCSSFAAAPSSAMAKTDSEKQELMDKLTHLVDSKFGGDWSKAFNHYARQAESTQHMDQAELGDLLRDAGVGDGSPSTKVVESIIKKLDSDSDNKISWEEFQQGLADGK